APEHRPWRNEAAGLAAPDRGAGFVSLMINGLIRQIGHELKRRAVTHAPVGRQQAIVRRTRMAERRARQPRNDLAPAYREKVSPHCQPPLPPLLVPRS